MSKILITGASGHLGTAVITSLLKKIDPDEVTALVRTKDKGSALGALGVHLAEANYDDYSSLLVAFKGIDKIYFVSGSDIGRRAKQHENVVNAAKESGVKHIVYTSFQRKTEREDTPIAAVAKSHLSTEGFLRTSGLTYTILQHGLYTDLIPLFAGDQVLARHSIYLPAENGKAAFALRTDFAEAGANVLLDETGRFANQSLELTGLEALSWKEIAEIISRISGQVVSYVAPTVSEYTEAMKEAKVPEEYIGLFAGFSQAIAEGEFERVTDDLKNLLGRDPAPVSDYLRKIYK